MASARFHVTLTLDVLVPDVDDYARTEDWDPEDFTLDILRAHLGPMLAGFTLNEVNNCNEVAAFVQQADAATIVIDD